MNTPPLLSLSLKAEPSGASGASGAAAGERAPSETIVALLEEARLVAWRPFPLLFLGATLSGNPPPTATWLKAARSAEALHFLFISEEPLRSGEGIAVLIDPVGDGEGYYEIGLSSAGFLQCAILRRSRSGLKRDARWTGDGVHAVLEAASAAENGAAGETGSWSAVFSIPYRAIADHAPRPGEMWLINAQRLHLQSGMPVRSLLERLPRFRWALFA